MRLTFLLAIIMFDLLALFYGWGWASGFITLQSAALLIAGMMWFWDWANNQKINDNEIQD